MPRMALQPEQPLPLMGAASAVPGSLQEVIAWRGTQPVSRAAFLRDVLAVSRALPEHARVINSCNDSYLFLVGFAAAAVRGQVTLMPPSRVPGVVVAIAEEVGDCYLLVDAHVADGALPQFRISVDPPDADAPRDLLEDPPAMPSISPTRITAAFTAPGPGATSPRT